MAIITLPTDLKISRQIWGQKRYDVSFQNGDTGAGQSRILAPPRWITNIVSPQAMQITPSAAWRAMILDLKGRINQLAVHNINTPAPAGTLRGSLTLTAAAAQYVSTFTLTGGATQAFKTLLRGDWIGLGAGSQSQLVSVSADAIADASGVMTVSIAQPLRYTQASGATVIWDKPTALFRVTGDASQWESQPLYQGGYSLDMLESWE